MCLTELISQQTNLFCQTICTVVTDKSVPNKIETGSVSKNDLYWKTNEVFDGLQTLFDLFRVTSKCKCW